MRTLTLFMLNSRYISYNNRKRLHMRNFRMFCVILTLGQVLSSKCMAQTHMTLKRVYDLAIDYSPVIKQAMLAYENANLEYDNYKKGFLPQLELVMNPIKFNRSFKLLQNPLNGDFYNVDNYTNTSYMGIQISKKVGITGGTLSLANSMSMLNEFSTGGNKFTTIPLFIGYTQPLLGGRKTYGYQRNIQNLKLLQAKKDLAYVIAGEQQKLANLYVSIVLEQSLLELCDKEVAIADSLIEIERIRYNEGSTALIDLYAVEAIKSERLLDKRKARHDLDKAYLSWRRLIPLDVSFPKEISIVDFPKTVDFADEFESYMKCNPSWSLSELNKELASYKRYSDKLATQFNANVSVNYGLNQFSESLANSFKRPLQCQNIELTLQIPICQWGINRNKRKIADNEYKSSELEAEDRISQDKDALATLVLNYNYFREAISIIQSDADRSENRCAQVRLKYEEGKISLSDVLTSALDVMDKKRKMLVLMQSFYECYLDLRTLTLCDVVCEIPMGNQKRSN